MIAKNTVKVNGKWFYVGQEITVSEETTSDFSQLISLPEETKIYKKTDINRMSTAELKDFAIKQGIKRAVDMTGGELKKLLIEKLGL